MWSDRYEAYYTPLLQPLAAHRERYSLDLWIGDAESINDLHTIRIDIRRCSDLLDESGGKIKMQMAHFSLSLQVPACRRSCGQNDQVASPEMPLTPNEMFFDFRRGTEIDDEDMARNGRQSKIIERVDDLRNIKPIPAPSVARLNNMLRRNIENSFLYAIFQRSLLHSSSSFLPTKDDAAEGLILT